MDPDPLPLHQLDRSQSQTRALVLVPALLLLIGLSLRLIMLGRDVRLSPDEALFASQSRLISHRGDILLQTTDLDKPPLTLFVTALSFRLLGPTEFAARLPNTLFSVLSLAVLYKLAQSLHRNRMLAVLAMLLWALSPYDLSFSATVFTDVQATFWTLVACWFSVRAQWEKAGIAAVLMVASKTNAVLFIPLVLALAYNASEIRTTRNILWRFGYPFLLGVGLLVLWDYARHAPSFLELGYQRNNPRRFIRSAELWPRLKQWLHWLSTITGSPILTGAFLAALPFWLVRRDRSYSALADWLIAGFALAFLAWHWLIAFNTYDRYIHTLVPFLLILAARIVVGIARPKLILAALLLLIVPSTLDTLRAKSDPYTGIDHLAAYLNTQLDGQIIYDHWLGWELAYYLGNDPHVIVLYMPLPDDLAADMAAQPYPRYFVAPSPQHAAPWIAALERAGVRVSTVYQTNGFFVYHLTSLYSAENAP